MFPAGNPHQLKKSYWKSDQDNFSRMSQLEVIGAGFGRTGTYSLKTALEILGYPCHHMETVALEGQGKIWARIVKGENVEVKL